MVDVLDITEATEEKLAHLMMGDLEWKPLADEKPPPEEVIFRVENLSLVTPEGLPRLKNISFSLRKGEILGLAGVAGSGQKELLEVLSGLRPCVPREKSGIATGSLLIFPLMNYESKASPLSLMSARFSV